MTANAGGTAAVGTADSSTGGDEQGQGEAEAPSVAPEEQQANESNDVVDALQNEVVRGRVGPSCTCDPCTIPLVRVV